MSLSRVDHDTPMGTLSLFAEGGALVGLYLPDHAARARCAGLAQARPCSERARVQLDAYFAGQRTRLRSSARSPRHGLPARACGRRSARSPSATTRSYGAARARRSAAPSASRAVGAANGQNPIAIVVPCHRVIGADGSLTGYGGGMARKEWLLRHERALPQLSTPS